MRDEGRIILVTHVARRVDGILVARVARRVALTLVARVARRVGHPITPRGHPPRPARFDAGHTATTSTARQYRPAPRVVECGARPSGHRDREPGLFGDLCDGVVDVPP
jgi:hypothetical protein